MGLDSQSNSDFNTALFPGDLQRNPELYSGLGQPVKPYVPKFSEQINNIEEWRLKAACKGLTQLFFPPLAERPEAKKKREIIAKKLCDSCSVSKDCLSYASRNDEFGYWAGTDEYDREAVTGRFPPKSSFKPKKNKS